MFSRKKSRAMMKMAHMDSGEMKSMVKIVAAGFVAYQAARYMMREMMD